MPTGFGLTPVVGWDSPKVGGRAPSARAGHSMTVVPPAQAAGTTTRVVVFGGCSNSGPKNDTYELESARDGALRWVAIAGTDAATTLAPPPRWRHSAALLGSSTVCVYGGSTDEGRLSDLWLLDTNSMAWSRPAQMSQQPAADVGAGSGAPTQFGWPAPRASHTMNNIGGQLYLFAGYGGNGFARHDFNDLWVACPGNEQGRTQTPWSFRVLQPAGRWPAPRADHRASVVDHQLFVCGGWSAHTQFRDLFVFDSVAVAWSQPDCGLPQPRWQHCLVSAHSVPYSKLFMFGGEAGELEELGQAQGSFCDGTSVLACDSFTWSSPAVTGHLPSPRADSAAVLVGQRLIIWGGWASRWLGDLHTLDVGEIVGPPYNVCTIATAQPAPVGCDIPVIPVTGGTEIRITGQGLEPFAGQAATVRFSCASGSVDAAAAVLGDGETVRCLAPDLSVLGAVDCEVRLQVGFGHGWSLAKLRARVHTTTHAASTLAFGPGILRGNGLGAETTFVIQAVSADGSTRNTGGDQFRVLVAAFGEDKGGERPEVAVEDRLDGTYTVVYTAPHEGTYTVSIEFLGTFGGSSGPVQGSPFLASFEACAGTDVVNNSMSGGVLLRFIQRSTDDLDGELRKLERDLSSTVSRPPEGLAPLLKVKRALIAVQRRQEAQGGFLRSTRSALQYLDTVECMRVGKDVGHAKRVQVQFDKVQDLAPLAAELIVQETAVQKQRMKEGVGLYQKALENKQRELRRNALWEYRTGYASAHEAIQEQQAALRAEAGTLATKSEHCEIFGFPALAVRCHELVLEMEREMLLMAAAWGTIEVVEHVIVAARAELWSAIKSDDLIDSAKGLLRRVNDIDKAVKQCSAFRGVKADALDFVKQAELAQLLKGSPMQVRHWEELSRAVGQAFEAPPMNPRLKLGELLDLGLHKAGDEVEDIADLSEKERKLGAILEEVGAGKGSWVGWRAAQWAMEPYQGTDTPVLTIDSDHYEILEKHQMDLQAQTTSKAMAHFHAEVVQWQQELNMVNEVFRLLNDMQRAWSYLEPLFVHSDEVRKELPETAALFLDIDAGVRAILSDAWATRVVLLACNRDGLEGEISALNSRLALCKKALVDFLDGRRRQFPRFYFMSEADLLDVLSHGSQPSKVVAHVPKIFLATKTFELKASSGRSVATHWVAIVGTERVSFEPEVKLEGKVEVYLQLLVDAMRKTMFAHLQRALKRYHSMKRIEWVMHGGEAPSDMAQVILLVSSMTFASGVEVNALAALARGESKALRKYGETQQQNLGDLVKTTRSVLSKGQRTRVMCMITLDAHNRDVVQNMIRTGVQTASHFLWQSLLKLCFCVPEREFLDRDLELREVGKRAECQILNAVLPYDYEYLGNGPRLVITPLTDRIYVTATQALNLKMGCAPAGPAGTGKTETTKDLAAALGKVCYVVNCSPEMDFKSMGNIFKGLASSGSWGCFDEFNRLIPEVLSVCSVQYKAICDGCRGSFGTIIVDGDKIALDPTVGAFITMNPGYLGRSTLPEGLKALFRPMTVMVPDLVLICENMLMAEGFEGAKALASKFYALYSLLAQLLSKQRHYDWGLRAVKSVLVVAGGFKRAEPAVPENHLLMRALRDFNTPKIVADDEVIFHGLLEDLFPGANPPRAIDQRLEGAVADACKVLGNDPDDLFRLKVVQFEELTQVRHCVFIMGPAGAGKSQVWRTLAKARELLSPERRTRFVDLNPKALSTKELYGYMVLATREWKDGLLSKQMRDLGEIADEKPKWLVLDGDLDANWIESMNSVMDDNRMLTLVSGERIPLKSHMKMIFEIRDLAHATPATVSRAGVLYISTAVGSQWRSLVRSWVSNQTRAHEVKLYLQSLFDKYLPPSLLFYRAQLKPVVPLEDLHMVDSLLCMLDGLLSRAGAKSRLSGSDWQSTLHKLFVFGCCWALGSGLSVSDDGVDHAKLFSDWWRQNWRSSGDIKIGGNANKNITEYFLDLDSTGGGSLKFEPWSKNKEFFYSIRFDSKASNMSSVMVPTTETCSAAFWIDLLIKQHKPVMLAGAAGTGKTQLLSGVLQRLGKAWTSSLVNFNFYTTSEVFQSSLEVPLVKKMGTKFGPPGNVRLVYFIDDINLPMLDQYGTQSAIALLRQQMEYGRIYDRRKDFIEKHIQHAQFVACLNPAVGSFVINPRLQRHFTTFATGMPSKGALQEIYETFLLKRDEAGQIIGGHLCDWAAEFQNISKAIVNAALSLHSAVAETFRKTANNFHYEFNVRHLSNVIQGLLVAQAEQFVDPPKLVELWLHESERVYADRLVSLSDIHRYMALAKKAYLTAFSGSEFSKIGRFFGNASHPLVFCHFCDSYDEERSKKVYDQADVLRIAPVLNAALVDYNTQYPAMNLSLFEDAMKHICRIVRVVMYHGGHALLVGVGGSGKQSLSRLAAFICHFTVRQICISSGFGEDQFLDDLRSMYYTAGVKDEGVMFLLADSQIVDERFLVHLNDLLSSGVVPDLFSHEAQDEIVGALKSRNRKRLGHSDRDAVWRFFIERTRYNLHCCLCFSPVSESFRIRAARFPALVNCTAIDWFQPWPVDALHAVGQQFLAHIRDLGGEEVRTAIGDFLPFCFATVGDAARRFADVEQRFVHTTPKSYLEMVTLFLVLLTEQRTTCDQAIERLESGLLRINDAGQAAAQIEAQLKVDVANAEEKKSVAEGIAENVAREKGAAEVESTKAEREQIEVTKIQHEVDAQQQEAKRALAAAEPAVAEAMAALDTIKDKEVKDVARLSVPPGQVGKVCEAVMVLLCGVKTEIPTKKSRGGVICRDLSWAAIKKYLLNDVKTLIREYLKPFAEFVEQGLVPARNFAELRFYLEGLEEVRGKGVIHYFNPQVIGPQSGSAAGLCMWCIAISKYFDIVTEVAPLRQALTEAEQQLEAANNRLSKVNAQVAELIERLGALELQLKEADASKQNAVDTVDQGLRKQDLARRLITALSSEKIRWARNVQELFSRKELLIGDVLLTSAFVSYVGPFTKAFREDIVATWIAKMRTAVGSGPLPMSDKPDPVSAIATAAIVAGWQTDGLPADRVSSENGSIVCSSRRWPLMIDPQLQGIRWVRKMEARDGRNLQIVRLGQPQLLQKLASAIENGHSLLVENMMESIDAVLNPVIQRLKIRRGSQYRMVLGDTELDYNDRFRLFLQTKLSNPRYPPEIQAECALVNFTVTAAGLEDQLLALTVAKERPDLAQTNTTLVQQQAQYKIKMQELEDDILQRLATAEGDITDNEELIVGLEHAKQVSTDVAHKSSEAARVQADIKVTSEKYRSVAARSSLLFFLLNDLVKMHTYYIYSLEAFTRVFHAGVDKVAALPPAVGVVEALEEKSDRDIADRCHVLCGSITQTTFNFVRRGLFEESKLTVAVLLSVRVLVHDGVLAPDRIEALLRPELASDNNYMERHWLPPALWPKVKGLEATLKPFRGFCDKLIADEDGWRSWFDAAEAETAKLPGDMHKALDAFDRLVLLRAMRPDRLPSALRHWVASVFGPSFTTQEPFNMETTFAESSPTTPIFFVLFAGVDPTPWVEALGHKLGMTEEAGKLLNISMGQGQEGPAEAVLERFAEVGGWAMLQNCHLMQSWVPRLEALFEACSEGAHADFRLFMSAEPPPIASWKYMPESLMQSCIKVANEAPSDIQSNLRRSWGNFSQEAIDQCMKPSEFKTCLLSLCWFHSIVLGRRRFGQQGWSRSYSFNTGDLVICADILRSYLDDGAEVPYEDLRYVFGDIMYGGHITDPWDRRTNNTYLRVLFNGQLMHGLDLGLGAGFVAPDPAAFTYEDYAAFIEERMVAESPLLFGMHPNAEIGFLTSLAEGLFKTILDVSGGGAMSGGAAQGTGGTEATMLKLMKRLPAEFNMVLLRNKTAPMLESKHGPYVSVALQECSRMNALLEIMRTSLTELGKGLKGQLNMSQGMEDLRSALGRNEVPGRNPFSACKWETSDPTTSPAWPSRKALVPWFDDLLSRVQQLTDWAKRLPLRQLSLWLPGLFNPMAFLTAVKQVSARCTGVPLDKLDIETHLTTMWAAGEVSSVPAKGDYIHGLFVEGASWPRVSSGEDDAAQSSDGDEDAHCPGAPYLVDSVRCAGVLSQSRPKELLPQLPLVYARAVEVQPGWVPTSTGYLRSDPRTYDCPVYATTFRGPTYVFMATLPTSAPVSQWVLGGVAIVFQTDD